MNKLRHIAICWFLMLPACDTAKYDAKIAVSAESDVKKAVFSSLLKPSEQIADTLCRTLPTWKSISTCRRSLESIIIPDSVKFGKFTLIRNQCACLGVNALNNNGDNIGDRQAYLIYVAKKWLVIDIVEASHDDCINIMSQFPFK